MLSLSKHPQRSFAALRMTSPHIEPHRKIGGLLKEAVFGFNDGLVSTLAVTAGLTGGLAEQKTVLLAALVTLFPGAFSMGLGTYLGSKSEKEHYEKERKREMYEMEHMPEVERQEIRDIYSAKGFKGKLLDEIVAHITGNDELWLSTMMREELGFAESPPKPGVNGLVMAAAFTVGGIIPALPFFFTSQKNIGGLPLLFWWALAASAAGLLLVGGLKTRFTGKSVLWSALETLGIGALAAVGSYGIGLLFV